MAETLRLKIVELLSRGINRLYSISEIAKHLKAAYSHCNTFVRELEKENVIKIIRIANAHICTLNLNENLTLAYLTLIEYRKAKEWKEKNKPRAGKIGLFVSRLKEKGIVIDTLFVDDSVYIVIPKLEPETARQIDNEKLGLGYVLLDREKFTENQDHFIRKHFILYGAERFWELVKKSIRIE